MAAALVVTAAACAGDGRPAEYGPDHRASFVEDCTTDVASRETCGCFYDRLAAEIPFDRFEEVEEARQTQKQATDLPADIAALAAGCAAAREAADVG